MVERISVIYAYTTMQTAVEGWVNCVFIRWGKKQQIFEIICAQLIEIQY